MNYDEIKSGLERQAQRRKYFQEQLAKSDPYNPNNMVSGRVVPYSPIQGLSKIAEAIINRQGMSAADKKEAELNEELTKGRAEAFGKMYDTYSGRDAVPLTDVTGAEIAGAPTRENAPIEANPVKAAMMARNDPFLADSGIGQMIMPDTNRGSYFTTITGPNGAVYKMNARTGEIMPTNVVAGKLDPTTQGNVAGAKQQGQKDVDLTMNPEITKAEALAQREADKIIEKPQVESKMGSSEAKTGMLGDLFAQARKQSNGFTTGIVSKATGWIPQSPAYDLNSTLATIKANIGFDRLQEMRDNSKTGGALGQVSERENTLLQQVWGDLDASTSKEQFDKNLSRVQKQVEESWKRVKKAYKDDYGVDYEETGGSPNPPTSQANDPLGIR